MHHTGGRRGAAPVAPRRRASAADPSRACDVCCRQRPAAVRAAQLRAAAQGCHVPHRARVVRPSALTMRFPSRAPLVRPEGGVGLRAALRRLCALAAGDQQETAALDAMMSINTDQWPVLGPAVIRAVELFIDAHTATGASPSHALGLGLGPGILQSPGPTKARGLVYVVVLRRHTGEIGVDRRQASRRRQRRSGLRRRARRRASRS
jgi:hypothetical protein